MKKPKSKGVERVKTDKSIKADHKGQNIIQTVKVTVQAPKEVKKVKRKRKTKSSDGASVTGGKKQAIAELQTNMEKFKSLKEQAQKLGVKLPASIGESKYSVDNVKTIADIKGLSQEIMLKNSQIEALIKGSPSAVSSSGAQLPQQASSFAPQIVEKSQQPVPPGTQPSGGVPTPTGGVPTGGGSPSDSDIDKALASIPKVKDEDIDKQLEAATGQTPTGSVVQDELKVATSEIVSEQGNATTTEVDGQQVLIKLNQLKDQARNANTLEVQNALAQQIGYDLGTKDRTTITTELTNNLESLPVDSLDDAYNYFKTSILLDQRGDMGTISPNVHDKILKALKMITNVTYTDQFTDLKGYHQLLVETDFADVEELPPDMSGIAPRTNPSDRPTITEEIAEQERENKISLAKMAADKANEEAKAKQEITRKEQEDAIKDDLKFQLVEKEANRTMTDEEFKAELTGAIDKLISDQGLTPGPKVVKEAIDKLESIEIVAESNNQDILELLRVISEKGDDSQKATAIQPEIVDKIKIAYRAVTMKDYAGPLTIYDHVGNVVSEVQNSQANEGKVQDVATPSEVQHIIDTFDKPISEQYGFDSSSINLTPEGKPDFRSLQKFLGDDKTHSNEFTYLQMIGSLKDQDIAFSKQNGSLSLRSPTAGVINNVNRFYRKLKRETKVEITPEPLPTKQKITYEDLVRSVQSKLKNVVDTMKPQTVKPLLGGMGSSFGMGGMM